LRSARGQTALHVAAAVANFHEVDELLRAGASPFRSVSDRSINGCGDGGWGRGLLCLNWGGVPWGGGGEADGGCVVGVGLCRRGRLGKRKNGGQLWRGSEWFNVGYGQHVFMDGYGPGVDGYGPHVSMTRRGF
jgi:hypothetical protein